MRLVYALVAEAFVLASLTALLLLRPHDPRTVRLVAGVLAASTALVVAMLVDRRRLLLPLVRRVGICEMCAAAGSKRR